MKELQLKNLGKTNLLFTSFAVAGYITIYFGWVLHIGLGIFQTLLCVFLVTKRRNLIRGIEKHLMVYGFLAVSDLILLFTLREQLFFIAWACSFAIAAYFTWIMYQLKKHHHENIEHTATAN